MVHPNILGALGCDQSFICTTTTFLCISLARRVNHSDNTMDECIQCWMTSIDFIHIRDRVVKTPPDNNVVAQRDKPTANLVRLMMGR